MSHTPWTVKSVSGFAGGTKRKAGVTLYIETESDTVEDVRRMVDSTPDLLAACEAALRYRKQTHHGDDPCLAILNAAIAKAKGA